MLFSGSAEIRFAPNVAPKYGRAVFFAWKSKSRFVLRAPVFGMSLGQETGRRRACRRAVQSRPGGTADRRLLAGNRALLGRRAAGPRSLGQERCRPRAGNILRLGAVPRNRDDQGHPRAVTDHALQTWLWPARHSRSNRRILGIGIAIAISVLLASTPMPVHWSSFRITIPIAAPDCSPR